MKITTKIAALIACTALLAGCSKAPAEVEPQSELDWSRTSTITLNEVAMASSTRAEDPLAIDQTFRLYAMDPKTKNIIASRTYTIKGTAGTPVVDDTQEKVIILPFGVVDIFLVGPVKATLSGVEYDIAGPTQVTPLRGVDLISSRTKVTINTSKTPIDPTALQHRMVKLELEVRMVKDVAGSALATYQDALMTDPKHFIGIDNMGDAGTFTFDNQGGSVIGNPVANYQYTYVEGNVGTGKIVLTTPGEEIGGAGNGFTGAVYTVTDYMIPIPDTTPKLSVTYGYTRRDAGTKTPIAAHMMSGKTTAPQAWKGGTYVKIATTLIPSIDMTLRPEIKPWDEGGTTPVEPPANNDLLFWYSGEDGPEVINEKLCWRDRSGNGNHAVIEGNMVYDPVNKCYYSTTGNGSFIVPALGKVAEYTLELTAQSVFGASNLPVNFSGADGAAGIGMNLPYADIIVWYCPDQIQYQYSSDKYIYEQLNSYAFCRNATTAAIVINGAEKKSVAMSTPWAPFDKNSIWGATRNVTPEKQRLYGAKMYKKYMNDATGRNTLAANHAAKLSQLGVNAPLSGTTFDYVKDGLILDLRGETAPTGTDPNRIWPDLSGRGNSPTMDATAVYNLHPTTGLHYYSGTVGETTLRLPKSMGTYKELTIEVVVDVISPSSTATKPLIQFSPDKDGYLRSSIYCNFPDLGYVFEAPWAPPYGQRVVIPAANLKYVLSGVSQRSCCRRGDKLYAAQNGYMYGDFVANVPSDKVIQLENGLIYTDWQHIYAIRIYNRALSDMERQHNYLVDKNKYKILP